MSGLSTLIKNSMMAKRPTRHRKGESHPWAKLTDEDIEMIRELREAHDLTYRELADKFEVSWTTIRFICTYRRRD